MNLWSVVHLLRTTGEGLRSVKGRLPARLYRPKKCAPIDGAQTGAHTAQTTYRDKLAPSSKPPQGALRTPVPFAGQGRSPLGRYSAVWETGGRSSHPSSRSGTRTAGR